MYTMSWSAFPIGGRVSKFWSADLLLVRNRSEMDETLKAVDRFYLVSMPGEVKYPTQGVNV